MQILNGGKDNPEFEGQRMVIGLDGKRYPQIIREKADLPKQITEREKEIHNKVEELKNWLIEKDVVFAIGFAIPPAEERKEGEQQPVFGSSEYNGRTAEIDWVVRRLCRPQADM